MSGPRRYVLVEGYGEVDGINNLLVRMAQARGDYVPWAKPLRWPNIGQWETSGHGGVLAGVEHVRSKGDVASLLIVRDEDDGCPREIGPTIGARIRKLGVPFRIAYVLLHPEYEVLFLPCLDRMAGRELDGRPGLLAGTAWDGTTWEARRGVKEWLSQHFPRGKAYKPSVDQRLMTQMIDLEQLSGAGVPCFGTLERSIAFLVGPGADGGVYP